MLDGTRVSPRSTNLVEQLGQDPCTCLLVPIVALETNGSNCFYHSISINPGRFNASAKILPIGAEAFYDTQHDVAVAQLNHLASRASGSLGASSPAPAVVKMALERKGHVKCVTVPDELSMQTLLRFAGTCIP
jgi:L-serine/L-threonine ammonia-lyase